MTGWFGLVWVGCGFRLGWKKLGWSRFWVGVTTGFKVGIKAGFSGWVWVEGEHTPVRQAYVSGMVGVGLSMGWGWV